MQCFCTLKKYKNVCHFRSPPVNASEPTGKIYPYLGGMVNEDRRAGTSALVSHHLRPRGKGNEKSYNWRTIQNAHNIFSYDIFW